MKVSDYVSRQKHQPLPQRWTYVLQKYGIRSFGLHALGFTGHSISLTSHFFHELSKPVKLRSVGLRGVTPLIAFLNFIETTPVIYRRVENLFVSTHSLTDDSVPGNMEALVNLYKPGYDMSSVEDIADDYEELTFHAVTRILSIVAPTLKNLHIIYEPYREFILPHVNLPQLVDLVVQGSYEESIQLRPGAAPIFNKLRRLRLTEVHAYQDGTLKAIVASAPNLTHLRLDCLNPYNGALSSGLKEFLGAGSQQPGATENRFPRSLESLVVHPGMLSPPGSFICGTGSSTMIRFSSMRTLRTLADTDPRFTLMKEDPYSPRSKKGDEEGLKAWLGVIDGQPSHWEGPSI